MNFTTSIARLASRSAADDRGWRRFSLTFIVAFAAVVGCIAFVNLLVDPFNLLGLNRIGLFVSNERVSKPRLVERKDYATLLIGSSKVASISPTDDVGDPRMFNASFGAALPEEMRNFLYLHARPGQTVLLGLDFYMFNATTPSHPKTFLDDSKFDVMGYLVSLITLGYSLESVQMWVGGREPVILGDGARNQAKEWREHNALADYHYDRVIANLQTNNYRDFTFAGHRLEVLRRIKDEMATRGVRVIAFLNPVNIELRRLYREIGEAEFQRFRHEIRQIFPDLYDFTGEEWSDPELYFRHDPYHYKPSTGGQFVIRMLRGEHRRDQPSLRD
jgi:hypothetical protein